MPALARDAALGMPERCIRPNLTPHDAVYVALAEVLACPLVTADAAVARAPGIRCAVEVLRRR